jgi:DNA-directed RNA polymerase subunit RPC12/RpoP
MDLFSTQFLPCLLCGNKLQKRTDKQNKPYFVCDPCGIQFFVRRQQGIERLDKLLRTSEQNAILFQQAAEHLYKVQALLGEIDGTKKQITKLHDEIGFFFPDEHRVRARASLKTKLDGLLKQLDEMCRERA